MNQVAPTSNHFGFVISDFFRHSSFGFRHSAEVFVRDPFPATAGSGSQLSGGGFGWHFHRAFELRRLFFDPEVFRIKLVDFAHLLSGQR
jgi:hypothetical protein